MNLITFTKIRVSAFTLAVKDPKRTVGPSRRSISLKTPVGKNTAALSPVTDTKLEKVVHWPEIHGNCCLCWKGNMTSTVKFFKCKVGLCLNKDRNCFKYVHNYLLVFSH